MPRIQRRAFTLVEMLVVIAIIAILAAILFPVLRGVRAKSLEADCGNNLRQLGVALYQFASTYGGSFPNAGGASYSSGQPELVGSLSEFVSAGSPAWYCRRYVAYNNLSPAALATNNQIGYFYWAYVVTSVSNSTSVGLDMNARTSNWQAAGNLSPSNAPLVLMSDRFTDSPAIQYHYGANYSAPLTEKGTHVLVSGGAVRKVAPR